MPAKLERCVKHVIEQGKDKNAAYAICSASTGWKKAGKHKWKKGKKVVVTESALFKIDQLLTENEDYLSKYRKGVYSSVTLEPSAISRIWKHLRQIGFPMMPENRAHVTVIYSRSRPQSEPRAWDINGQVQPTGFGIFGKGTPQEPYALVLKVKSPDLIRARQKWIRDYRIQPIYKDGELHITLTYDINRIFPGLKKLNEKQKKTITGILDRLIPELPKNIRILKHTVEPL